ncbi:MAG TPA: hypothetical protein VJL59_24255 [Anaerolineales bacterium]|nr:hypothetical protein [Anaerolineales bacterium]
MTRLTLFALLLVILSLFAALFRRLGLGEVALIAAVLALAFCVEIVRFVVKQVMKGYRR